MNKSKNVSIKLGKILEVFDIKKNHDEVISRLGILEEDGEEEGSDGEEEGGLERSEVGKDRLRLRPRGSVNANNNQKTNTNNNSTNNNNNNNNISTTTNPNNKPTTSYNTPKFG